MTCPKCQSSINAGDNLCPECGAGLYRNVSGIIRTSAVMISADGEDRFFHSVQEVPEPLRRRLMDTTQGDNAGIIVIADRAGKEQLTQAYARRAETRRRTAGALADLTLPDRASSPEPYSAPNAVNNHFARFRNSGLAWAGFLAVLAAAAALSAFLGTRW